MFVVTLPPDWVALAMKIAEERPKNVGTHIPPGHPDAEIAGTTAEVAYCLHHQFPRDSVSSEGGDPGWDFCHGIWASRQVCHGTKVDVKSSSVHEDSWVVKAGKLAADWFVFAYVELPDRVTFRAKATREQIEPHGLVEKVGNKRLIRMSGLQDISPNDFR